MNTDPNRWINTIPGAKKKFDQEKYSLDSDRCVNTLPKKNVNKRIRLYSLTAALFIVGLIY